jgi:hypothetical protein
MRGMRNEIIELARDPTFVPHIYDYCDLWCGSCPATSHCLLFRAEEIRHRRSHERGQSLEDEIGDGIEFAKAVAEATRTPIAELDVHLADPASAPRAPAFGHPLELLARHYALQAGRFLESTGVEAPEQTLGRQAPPLTVIAWYHVLIAAKTYRALVSAHASGRDPAALGSDASGSAKVALLGIDRSIASFREVAKSDADARIDGLLELLETLRAAIETRFPEARAFIRPGLDANGPADASG